MVLHKKMYTHHAKIINVLIIRSLRNFVTNDIVKKIYNGVKFFYVFSLSIYIEKKPVFYNLMPNFTK